MAKKSNLKDIVESLYDNWDRCGASNASNSTLYGVAHSLAKCIVEAHEEKMSVMKEMLETMQELNKNMAAIRKSMEDNKDSTTQGPALKL